MTLSFIVLLSQPSSSRARFIQDSEWPFVQVIRSLELDPTSWSLENQLHGMYRFQAPEDVKDGEHFRMRLAGSSDECFPGFLEPLDAGGSQFQMVGATIRSWVLMGVMILDAEHCQVVVNGVGNFSITPGKRRS